MSENKPIWCFVDGKVPIFIDKSEDAKFPILTNGRRYKKDSREWLHKTSNNRGKNRKRTCDSRSETMSDSDTKQEVQVNSENISGAMDTGKDSDVSQSPFHFEGNVLDNKENQSGHDVRLSPFQFFGRSEDREMALNQNGTRSCMTRSESSRRLRKRRLTWLKTEKNGNCCTEIAEGASQHHVELDRPRFRPIAEEVELEEACQLLDPMTGRSHGDVNSHSLEISASFWFDTDDSNDGTWWRETKQSSSESSLEDFMPELREGDRPIDPTFIRSPVPKKREKLALSSEEYDEERPEMAGPLGHLYFRRIPRSPPGPPPDETDSE